MNTREKKQWQCIDDSPEKLVLIDELIKNVNETAELNWNKFVGKEADDVLIQQLAEKREAITKKIVETPFEPSNVYYNLYKNTRANFSHHLEY